MLLGSKHKIKFSKGQREYCFVGNKEKLIYQKDAITVFQLFKQNKSVQDISKILDLPIEDINEIIKGITESNIFICDIDSDELAEALIKTYPEIYFKYNLEYNVKLFNNKELEEKSSKMAEHIENGLKEFTKPTKKRR